MLSWLLGKIHAEQALVEWAQSKLVNRSIMKQFVRGENTPTWTRTYLLYYLRYKGENSWCCSFAIVWMPIWHSQECWHSREHKLIRKGPIWTMQILNLHYKNRETSEYLSKQGIYQNHCTARRVTSRQEQAPRCRWCQQCESQEIQRRGYRMRCCSVLYL